MKQEKNTCILVVGHGSRRGNSNQEFEKFISEFSKSHQDKEVRIGYIELAEPSLEDSLQQAAREFEHIVVMPLFLFTAGHVKNDIPLIVNRVRGEFPRVNIVVTEVMGVDPRLARAIDDRLVEAAPLIEQSPEKYAVVVVGRGSSDPDANGDFHKLVRLMAEGRKFAQAQPTFIGITTPRVAETLDLISRARPEKLILMPYLIFKGVLVEKMEALLSEFSKKYSWIDCQLAPYLGPHAALLEIMNERIEQALKGVKTLPCDTCQYRVEMPGHAEKMGGLKSLLWSLRHTFTHTQAMPAEHAHPPMKKHVLVCGNVDCADKGALPLIENLRRDIKSRGLQKELLVTKTSCMGRCGEGPNAIVYPDGIFYRDVTASDAEELVEEHLLNDRLVSRLVDNIMQ